MRRILNGVLLSAACLMAAPAFAMSHLAVVGSLTSSTAKDAANNSWSADGLGLGGGVLFDAGGGGLDFEIGALYLQRKVSIDSAGITTKIGLNGFEVPIGLRYWLANTFSLGGGVYYLHYTSAAVSVVLDSTGVSASASTKLNGADLGAYASGQFRLPVGSNVGFLIDARYNLGFRRTTGDVTAKFKDLQGLVGLSFSI